MLDKLIAIITCGWWSMLIRLLTMFTFRLDKIKYAVM